jgi:hypothetical protein
VNIKSKFNNKHFPCSCICFVFDPTAPSLPLWAMAASLTRFLDHTQRRTTVVRIPLDVWPTRRREIYLQTHYIHNRQTSMSSLGFEHTISAGGRPQTYALDRAATGTGCTTVQPSHKFNTKLLHQNIYCWLVLIYVSAWLNRPTSGRYLWLMSFSFQLIY